MIRSQFETLRRQKEQKEDRKISIRKIADEAGVSINTVQRLRKGELDRVYISTLDKFCYYFGLRQISDLIEFTAIHKGD